VDCVVVGDQEDLDASASDGVRDQRTGNDHGRISGFANRPELAETPASVNGVRVTET
jgi:hypothetical protein